MTCEECLNFAPDYFDEELDASQASRVAAHLAACGPCSLAQRESLREQELLAHYRRDDETSPTLWADIQARVEANRDVRVRNRLRRFGERFRGLFIGTDPAPIFAAALIVLIAVLTWQLYATRPARTDEMALHATHGDDAPASGSEKTATIPGASGVYGVEGSEHLAQPSDSGHVPPRERNTFVERREHAGPLQAVSHAAPSATRADAFEGERLDNTEQARYEAAALGDGDASAVVTNTVADEWESSVELDAQTSKHVEQMLALLRQFRHKDAGAEEIAFDRQQSRRLLYRNMLLRGAAASSGNMVFEKVLDNVEPILVDIANLPEQPSPSDVEAIRERIQQQGMIARLQVY
jgi:hypothetical protein